MSQLSNKAPKCKKNKQDVQPVQSINQSIRVALIAELLWS